jgi:hypothetical protein
MIYYALILQWYTWNNSRHPSVMITVIFKTYYKSVLYSVVVGCECECMWVQTLWGAPFIQRFFSSPLFRPSAKKVPTNVKTKYKQSAFSLPNTNQSFYLWKENLPNVKGTIYKRAGCPWPSIRFKATYVTSRPEGK